MMELEELIKAFENKTSVVVRRFQGLEAPLHFDHITALIPNFDKNGQPDYTAELVDSVGRPCTARAIDISLG